jgi:hypothetical protein
MHWTRDKASQGETSYRYFKSQLETKLKAAEEAAKANVEARATGREKAGIEAKVDAELLSGAAEVKESASDSSMRETESQALIQAVLDKTESSR